MKQAKHTLLRRVWKGKDIEHCKELIKQLNLNLFEDLDNKNNHSLQIPFKSA